MVKIGVIGCGKIAQTRHLPEYATNPHAKLVGYYDKIRERSVQMPRSPTPPSMPASMSWWKSPWL